MGKTTILTNTNATASDSILSLVAPFPSKATLSQYRKIYKYDSQLLLLHLEILPAQVALLAMKYRYLEMLSMAKRLPASCKSQNLLQGSSGTVESIDFAAGTMKIKGEPNIRINDPNAVYSVGYTKSPLYTADDENPSITAFSGFSMCAPATTSCGSYAPPTPTSSAASSGTALASVDPSGTGANVDPSRTATSTPISSNSAAASTPTIAIGGTQTTRPGVQVKLGFNVTNKADFTASDLAHIWTQVSGPSVTLSSNSAVSPSFTAPASMAKATYIFNIKASSTSAGTSGNANITVVSDPAVADVVSIDSYTYNSSGGGSVSVTASTNIVGYNANLKLYLTNTATGIATAMTYNGGGKYSINMPKIKKPANGITVVSDGKGSKSFDCDDGIMMFSGVWARGVLV